MTTLNEINQKAQAVLRAALGPAEYVRYQQQFTSGKGDHTAERQVLPETDSAIISQRVADMKKAGLLVPPPNAKVVTDASA